MVVVTVFNCMYAHMYSRSSISSICCTCNMYIRRSYRHSTLVQARYVCNNCTYSFTLYPHWLTVAQSNVHMYVNDALALIDASTKLKFAQYKFVIYQVFLL